MQNHELTIALKERNKLLLDAEKAIQILHQQSGGISPSEEIDRELQKEQNSELQHYKELLQKEREEKQNISNEANGLKRQLLDVKNQMQETNSELTELKRLQEATIKNFKGLHDEEIIDNREMTKKIKDASDKARQEEAEKHGVLIQQLKGVSRQFLTNIRTNFIILFDENCNLN